MKLEKYLKEIGISKAEFCRRAGISTRTLDNILNYSKKDLRLSIALKIQKETKGKVSCGDLIDENKKD